MRKFFLALLAILSINTAAAQGINFDTSKTWQELLSQSAVTNKYIFLDCYTSWCGPCKGMSEQVFPQKAVGDFMNANFICTNRDMEKGEGVDLNKKYKSMIPGYPTYLVINSSGEVVYQASGFMDADKFIAAMKDALSQRSWIAFKKRFEAGENSWEFYREYLELLEAAYQKEALADAKKTIIPELTYDSISANKSAYLIFKKYWTDVTDPMFRQFMSGSGVYRTHKDPEEDVLAWAGRLYDNTVRNITNDLIKEAGRNYDFKKTEQFLSDMRQFSFKGREENIAMLLAADAIAKKEVNRFFRVVDNAHEFGLLSYKAAVISDLCMALLGDSKDKIILAKCLEYTKVDLGSRMLIPAALKNYAHFLEKTGDPVQAKIVKEKADAAQKDFEKKFGLNK